VIAEEGEENALAGLFFRFGSFNNASTNEADHMRKKVGGRGIGVIGMSFIAFLSNLFYTFTWLGREEGEKKKRGRRPQGVHLTARGSGFVHRYQTDNKERRGKGGEARRNARRLILLKLFKFPHACKTTIL